MSDIELKDWYTTGEVARMFNVTRQTVRNWIREGLCPAFRSGPKGHMRIPISSVKILLRHGYKKAQETA